MSRPCRFRIVCSTAFALALAVPWAASAACSRPVLVPVAAIGNSVIINGAAISGLYPELLRDLGEKHGCRFAFSAVPRARLEAMFVAGQADILIPATRTPTRDKHGHFVPLIASRAVLMSIDSVRAPIRSARELIERKELRVTLVRGFDYGDAYQELVAELTRQGRVYLEADAVGVARLLNGGLADLTIMAPGILAGAVENDARVAAMLPKLRIEAIPELPWGFAGAYISRRSVDEADRAQLESMLDGAARSGTVWELFKRYYQPNILAEGMRPR